MSNPIRFLVCPQFSYEGINRGTKTTEHNPMINISHLIEVKPIGKTVVDFDTNGHAIKDSFKYRVYFYTIKGDLNWYFDTEKSMNDWIEKFQSVYGSILKE
jgi:hypothetical protein